MKKINIRSLEQVEAEKIAIKEAAQKRIDDAKLARSEELKAINLLGRKLKAKEAEEKKKAETRAKIVLGIVLIDMANLDPSLKAKVEQHTRELFEHSPSRVESGLLGLTLTVTKPKDESWKEEL